MKPFALQRAHDRAAAIAAAVRLQHRPARGERALSRRRNHAYRPHEARRRAARECRRHQAPGPRRHSRAIRRQPAHRSVRHQQRPCAPSAGPAALCRSFASHPCRRIDTAAQCRDDGGQSAAADTLRLLPQHRHALQQAGTGLRLLRHHRRQPHDGHPGNERRLHRQQSVRHGRGDAGLRRDRACGGRLGRPAASRSRTSILLPQDRPDKENVLEPGRPRHARHAAAAAGGRAVDLSQAARSRLLRVRARFLRLRPPSYPTARSPASASRLAASAPDPGASSTPKPR